MKKTQWLGLIASAVLIVGGGSSAFAQRYTQSCTYFAPLGPGKTVQLIVDCPEGTDLVGGGYNYANQNDVVFDDVLVNTFENGTPVNGGGWEVMIQSRSNLDSSFRACAECLVSDER